MDCTDFTAKQPFGSLSKTWVWLFCEEGRLSKAPTNFSLVFLGDCARTISRIICLAQVALCLRTGPKTVSQAPDTDPPTGLQHPSSGYQVIPSCLSRGVQLIELKQGEIGSDQALLVIFFTVQTSTKITNEPYPSPQYSIPIRPNLKSRSMRVISAKTSIVCVAESIMIILSYIRALWYHSARPSSYIACGTSLKPNR